jgi:hypothetical protein
LQVLASLKVKKTNEAIADAPLILDAEDLVVNTICVNDTVLSAGYGSELLDNLDSSNAADFCRFRSGYSWAQNDVIEIKGPLPDEFTLTTDVTIKPEVFCTCWKCH